MMKNNGKTMSAKMINSNEINDMGNQSVEGMRKGYTCPVTR
jgi:hypothetical protein